MGKRKQTERERKIQRITDRIAAILPALEDRKSQAAPYVALGSLMGGYLGVEVGPAAQKSWALFLEGVINGARRAGASFDAADVWVRDFASILEEHDADGTEGMSACLAAMVAVALNLAGESQANVVLDQFNAAMAAELEGTVIGAAEWNN
jgi:hypothetical protein